MKRRCIVVGVLLMTCVSLADSYHWVGGNTDVGGGWNTAANWVNDSTHAAEVPTANSRVYITNSIVANDADVALLSSLKKIRVDTWNTNTKTGTVFTLDVSSDVTLACAINGFGRLVKKGGGTVTLTAADTSEALVHPYSSYGIYYMYYGGIYVDEGTLVLSQNGSILYDYGIVHIAKDATVVLNANETTCFEALYGTGTVRQDGATVRALKIGWVGYSNNPDAEFSGLLTGAMTLAVWGNQIISSEENDFTGNAQATYGRGTAPYARLGATKLGMLGSVSSLGKKNDFVFLSYGGHFTYLGRGETSDRTFVVAARAATDLLPQYFDTGTNGGLRLTGYMDLRSYGSEYNMRSFVFTGSNTVASTMAGPLKLTITDGNNVRYDFYVRKEGPGEWVFEKNDGTTFGGVFDVREGTLSFDSLANTGTLCALGYSTNLSKEFSGKWNDSYGSRYAFRVGTTNLTDAAPAVFAFVGSNSCSAVDRPLLLTGDAHFRANGRDGAAIDFSDVSASAGAAVKTLVLDGTNTAGNTMREVADGDGRVSVVKDGPGSWTLRGDQTFSGTLSVKAGELAVRDRVPYSWYRFTVRENASKGGVCSVGRLAFYDSDGTLLTGQMSFKRGSQYDGNYYYAVDPATLSPGECCYAPFSSTPEEDNYYSTNSESPDVLFKGGGSQGSRVYYRTGTTGQSFSANYSGARLVLRLPAGSPEATRYDVSTLIHDGWLTWRITAWTVEGSTDGVNWIELDKVDNKTDVSEDGVWYSDGVTAVSGNNRPDAGYVIDLPAEADQLAHVEAISVATNACLTIGAESKASAIGKIVIDGTAGAGKIRGGTFAANIVVDVTGTMPLRGGTFPVDFAEVGNIDGIQPVFTLNGEPSSKYSFRLTASELTILPPGLIMVVR